MASPFDIIKILNEKKAFDRNEVIADYAPWVINKGLSNMMDTVFFAAEMSKFMDLPKDMQFDFYYHAIPKGKRYGEWNKQDKSLDDVINKIEQLICCNRRIAKQYLDLLSDEEKQKLLHLEGGK